VAGALNDHELEAVFPDQKEAFSGLEYVFCLFSPIFSSFVVKSKRDLAIPKGSD
jgi:hypothetical protein